MNIFQNNLVSKMSMLHPVFQNNYYIRTTDLFDNLAVVFYKSWILVVMRAYDNRFRLFCKRVFKLMFVLHCIIFDKLIHQIILLFPHRAYIKRICAEKITLMECSKEPSLSMVKKNKLSLFGQLTRHSVVRYSPMSSSKQICHNFDVVCRVRITKLHVLRYT